MRGWIKKWALALLLLAPVLTGPAAAQTPCPLPGQSVMLMARLYFGQSIPGQPPLSARQWRGFLNDTVTPRFPEGFTVYDARGQWRDPGVQAIVRETSKVVEIAAADTPDAIKKIGEITHLYQDRFHQQSVGVVTSTACAAF